MREPVELVKVVTPEQIAELEDLLARQRQVLDAGRPNEFFALDEALHRRLLEFMGRERIWTLLQSGQAASRPGPLALRRTRLRTGPTSSTARSSPVLQRVTWPGCCKRCRLM